MTTKSLSIVTATLLLTTNTFADETLEEITVTSVSKTTQNIKDITSNTSVITTEDMAERGYTTVVQALNGLAGISYTSSGGLGQATSVRVRGMDSKRILVLIDGIRYNNVTSTSGANFEDLMIENIEQIEVVKGAQSGVWGADASAGVINIITKRAKDGVHGSAHIEGGTFNTKKYGATLSSATANYYFKVSHNVVETDGFTAQTRKDADLDKFEDDGYTNKTTSLQLGFNINETNKIDLSHMVIDTEGEYDPFGNPDGEANSNTKNTFSSINFNHVDSFNELNIYAKQSVFEREFIEPDYMGTMNTTSYNGEVKEYGFTSKVPYRSNDFVLFGADYKNYEHEDAIGKEYDSKGLFVTNSNTFEGFIGGKTIFTQSLRHDNYSTFDNKTTGKIGLKHIHEKIKGLTTSMNYGTAYNVPTLYQLYSAYGSPTLNPESTKSFNVTVEYRDLSITYFDTKIDDMIDFDMTTFAYNNISGTSKISGFEVSYQNEIFESLLFNVNYTHLLKAKNYDGEDLLRRAKDTLKIAVDYYGIEKLHLGIDAQYVGSRTDVMFNADYTTTEVETGKYTLVNFTVDYAMTEDVKVYGKIENLTDEAYETVYGYSASPRTFSLGLKAKF